MPVERPPGLKAISLIIGLSCGALAVPTAPSFCLPNLNLPLTSRLIYLPMMIAGFAASIGIWRLAAWSRHAFVLFVCAFYLPFAYLVFGASRIGDFWLVVLGVALAFGTARLFRYLGDVTRSAA